MTDLLEIPQFLRLAPGEVRPCSVAPRYQLSVSREAVPSIRATDAATTQVMRRSNAARDRRADAVSGAVSRGADTFQALRKALTAMDEAEIRSGLRRALELAWIIQDGRRYRRA